MSTALVRTSVNFHGDQLEAIQQDGVTYAPVKPICDILGLDWEAQRQRIQRDEVLSEGACMIQVPTAGGLQDALCLPDEMLHGWLFGVDVKRVREELRIRLILYKRECYRVLHEAFSGKVTGLENVSADQLRQIIQTKNKIARIVKRHSEDEAHIARLHDECEAIARGELVTIESRSPVEYTHGRRDKVLAFIAEHDNVRHRDIVQSFGIPPATATRYLDYFSTQGLVERQSRDRDTSYLITDEGRIATVKYIEAAV